MTYYAATNLSDRTANTGKTRRALMAFASKALRDQYVREYPTNDCAALRYRDLTAGERERLQTLYVRSEG